MFFFVLFHIFASILAKKDGWWLNTPGPYWYKYMQDMRHALLNGQVVRITDAFEAPERFDAPDDAVWYYEPSNLKYPGDHMWYSRYVRENTSEVDLFLNEISNIHKLFFGELLSLNTSNMESIGFASTKYNKSCYLETHNDKIGNRRLSLIYHNTRNSPSEECGGDFVWYRGLGVTKFKPSYNTLYLFIPTFKTHHAIDDVHCSERTAISGWLEWPEYSSTYALLADHAEYRVNSGYSIGDPFSIDNTDE
tara:strand:- start:278 stop:1027 length:750 start_codon:yes stop_codon:yes gene_type:complete